MSKFRSDKYAVQTRGRYSGRMVNKATGEMLPEDEPVFIIRAQDAASLEMLDAYMSTVQDLKLARQVDKARKAFHAWQRRNKSKVKEAD